MSDFQVVLDGRLHTLAAHPPTPLWRDLRVLPAYVAALSAVVLVLHLIASLGPIQRLLARLSNSEIESTVDPEDVDTSTGMASAVKKHVASLGGVTIFLYNLARAASVLALLGMFITSFVRDEDKLDGAHGLAALRKHWGKKHQKKHRQVLTQREWVDMILCITYLYASFLALATVTAKRSRSAIASGHLAVVLLAGFGVYAYRDIWPLVTFTLVPADAYEGPLLWAKVSVLAFAGIIIPFLVPRRYIPYNPKEPAQSSEEQTASILSMMTYTFLDPVVFLGYRVPHLELDQLPILSDYDYARNLVDRSFKHLDTFSGAAKRHLFFGLMATFRYEYAVLTFMMVARVLTSFLAPVGINRLLNYLETGGEGAIVRPWVWITALFWGPLLGTMAMQWYIYIATGTLVRTEGIITQLVFEHALRIRMKAETSAGTPSPSTAPTPDNVSVVDVAAADDTGSGSGSGDETVVSNGTSAQTSSSVKGKQKAQEEPAVKDALAKEEPKDKADNLVGKINNLISTDLSNITDGRDFLFLLLFAPLMVIICIWFLYTLLGWSAFVGLAVMIVCFPLPGALASMMQTVQKTAMKKTDARVETVTEMMNVLRMVKLFGWEQKISDLLTEKRNEELIWIRLREFITMANNVVNFIIPVLQMIATYGTFTLIMKRDLSPSIVFSTMAVFDLLRDQLHLVFYMVPEVIKAKVSLDRVTVFLHDTELLDVHTDGENGEAQAMLSDAARFDKSIIGFHDASFTWSRDDANSGTLTPSRRKFVLRIPDEVTFVRGRINLIIGPTGSGKTSLLMALLGEMHFVPSTPGSWYNLPRDGGVAYAAQQSWVQNETIRDNILFGAPYDEDRYNKVIYQCGLKRDLTLFEAGDRTEVGEKGLTLSGGQKARVTLARAIYSSAKILLLDDVLAALDVHTARWIVDKCLKGDLVRGRTVLLVTHNIAMASPVAHYVVKLSLDGTIASHGSMSDALADDKELSQEVAEQGQLEEKAEEEVDGEQPDADAKQADGKLIVAEEVALGHVSWSALNLFFSTLGGKYPLFFWSLFLGGLIVGDIFASGQTWFMGYWAEQYDILPSSEVNVVYYLGVWILLVFGQMVASSLGIFVYVFGVIRAAKAIHKQLIGSILGTTLRWLDTTPTSRVITRCTQDIRAIDGPFAHEFQYVLEVSSVMLIKLASIVIVTPIFVFPGIALAVLGGWCGQIYMAAQLSVKREMSNAKAPVLGHFGAAITGLTSIRAYGAEKAFRLESYKRIDRYTRSARTFYNLNRWVSSRIDALGGLFAASLAAYLMYGPGRAHVLPSSTGFSLTMAVGFSGMILWWVRLYNDFEVSGNSLERIQAYVEIEQEKKPTKDGIPPAAWPTSGDLRVEKLSARYSPDGPVVLHDLTFDVKAGERVGIVGRTGSGKSSLTLSLLRSIVTEGKVYYDGLPTDTINLDALRTKITIIPQMPELLSGSLRENLDPFKEHDDAVLNSALRASGLFSLQSEDDEGRITLDSQISSGGGNLSVGQRQILALARAIVRGSKLLILDEATSSIDYETDTIIQSSLRNELGPDVTLLTVAHRLQTIMDSDKIMVLDAGRIIEYDSPSELLKKKDGALRSLVDESGDKDALYAMAAGKPAAS